ncbi:xanthine dehydrogenase accessory protein XdhC [Vibrio fluvialis]|uniref:XdhC protein n=1 Tax=Vibrio fluvialis PG41 TaxID=1336752 RepID=S7JJL1_VIBFL|nr:xanthine dehydrogenase accessory protein XdhC [Vibrio fluvialis]EPP24246.1 XdhC protein [Vibrio fluvialis PG41]MBY7801787.1 xanthine dehydrogenase accessory protein XdhC [Vibrio fluvialis]MBY7843065.1 xanthine dehydrogenase accessory protein XdhC [Vibrio fluvialis]MBY8108612.1 xanthine dehydrogenase accessory protein XdhC [Vibrio fluvialis]WIE05950.1 xanthine dehydrogenase accessory protein XdhC [Vibrio fluvialis]
MSFSHNTFLASPGLNWLAACQQLEQRGEAYCIATVVAYVGSVPRTSGAKMVITETAQFDTLGGGNLEFQVIAQAREHLKAKHSDVTIERFSLAADLAQCCGGAVQVMFEYFQTQTPQVVIFGAGHVCQALTRVLSELPCHVKVVDNRAEWLTPLAQLGVETHHCDDPRQAMISLNDNAYLIIMTQDHALDFELTLSALEARRFAFVGLIGSQGKRQRFEFRLKEQLSNPSWIDALTCPIGHPDVQGKLPMQVAVSVAAQLIGLFALQIPTPSSGDAQWQQANQARKSLKETHE